MVTQEAINDIMQPLGGKEAWIRDLEKRNELLSKSAIGLEEENEKLRETLAGVMLQVESDFDTAHAEICKHQNIDAAKYNWPEWSPQANTLCWFEKIRDEFNIPYPKPESSSPEDDIAF